MDQFATVGAVESGSFVEHAHQGGVARLTRLSLCAGRSGLSCGAQIPLDAFFAGVSLIAFVALGSCVARESQGAAIAGVSFGAGFACRPLESIADVLGTFPFRLGQNSISAGISSITKQLAARWAVVSGRFVQHYHQRGQPSFSRRTNGALLTLRSCGAGTPGIAFVALRTRGAICACRSTVSQLAFIAFGAGSTRRSGVTGDTLWPCRPSGPRFPVTDGLAFGDFTQVQVVVSVQVDAHVQTLSSCRTKRPSGEGSQFGQRGITIAARAPAATIAAAMTDILAARDFCCIQVAVPVFIQSIINALPTGETMHRFTDLGEFNEAGETIFSAIAFYAFVALDPLQTLDALRTCRAGLSLRTCYAARTCGTLRSLRTGIADGALRARIASVAFFSAGPLAPRIPRQTDGTLGARIASVSLFASWTLRARRPDITGRPRGTRWTRIASIAFFSPIPFGSRRSRRACRTTRALVTFIAFWTFVSTRSRRTC